MADVFLKETYQIKSKYIRLKAYNACFCESRIYFNKKGGISSTFFAPNLP
jgi:hypothetical protein